MDENPPPDTDTNTEGDRSCSESHESDNNIESSAVLNTSKLLPVQCSYIVNSPKYSAKKNNLDLEDIQRKRIKNLNEAVQNAKEKDGIPLGDNVAFNSLLPGGEINAGLLFENSCMKRVDSANQSVECRSHHYDGYIAGRRLWAHTERRELKNAKGFETKDVLHKPEQYPENVTSNVCKSAKLRSDYGNKRTKAKAPSGDGRVVGFLYQSPTSKIGVHEIANKDGGNQQWEIGYNSHGNANTLKHNIEETFKTPNNSAYLTKPKRPTSSPQNLKSASVASSFLESRSCKNRKIMNEETSKSKRESNHSNNFITDTDANGNSLEKGSTKKGKIHNEFFEGKEAVEAINSALGKRALSLYRNDIRSIAAQMENFPQAPADNAECYRGFQELHLESEKSPWVKEGLDGIDIDAKFGHLTNLVCCDEVNCNSESAKIIIQKNMKLMDNKLQEDDTSYDDSFSSPNVRKRPCVIKTSPRCASKSKQHQSEHDGVVRSGKNNNRNKKDSTQSEHCKPPRHVRGGYSRTSPRKSDLTVGNVREMTKRYQNQKSIDVFEKVNAWIKHDMTVLTSGGTIIGNADPLESEHEESSASNSKKRDRSKNENASPTTAIEELNSKSTRSTVKELTKMQGDCANTGKEDKMTSCTTLRKKNKRNRKLPSDHITRKSEYSSCTDRDEFISAKSTLTAKLVNNRSPDTVCKQESPPIQFVEYIHYAPIVQRKISRSRKRSPKSKKRHFSYHPDGVKTNFWKRADSPKRVKKLSTKGDKMLSAATRKRNASLHRGKDHKNPTPSPKRRARSLHVSRIDSSRSPGQLTFSSSPRRKIFHSRKPIEVNIETKGHNQPRTKEEKWERILIKEKIREASKKQAEDVNRLIKENEEQLDRKLQAIEKRRKVGVPRLNLYKYMEQPTLTEDTCDYYNPHQVQNYDMKTVDYEQGGVYYQKAKKAGNFKENDNEEDDDDVEETAHYHKNWKVDYLEYLRGRELYTDNNNSDPDITVEAVQQPVLKTKTRKQRINFNSLMMPEMRVENVNASEGENAKQSSAQNVCKQRVDWGNDFSNRADDESVPKKKKRRQKKIYVVKRNNKRSKSASSTESNTLTLSKNQKQLQNCKHESGAALDLKRMAVSKADSLPIAENTACLSVSQQRHLAKAETPNNKGNITPVVQKLVEEYLRNENMLIQSQRLQEELNAILVDQETNQSEQTKPRDMSELISTTIATESKRNQKHSADETPNEHTSLFFASSADMNAIAGLRESQQNGEQDAITPLVLQDVEVELDANGCVQEKKKDKTEVEVQTEMHDYTTNVPKPQLLSFNKDVPVLSTDNEDLFDTILKFSRTNPIPSPVVQLFVHEPNDRDLASNVKSLCQAIDGAKDALHKMKRQRLFLNGTILDSHEKAQLVSDVKIQKPVDSHEKAHLVSDVKIPKPEPTAEPLEKDGKKVDKGIDPVSNPVGIESTDNLFPASKTRAIILEAIASVLKNVRRKSLEEEKINDQKINEGNNGGQKKTTHSAPDCKPSELNPEVKARNMPPSVTDEKPKQSKNQNKPRLKRRQRQYKCPYERQSSEFGCDFVSPPKAVLHPIPRQRSPNAKSAPQSIVSSCTKSATYLSPNTTLGRFKQRLESPTTKHCENIGRSQIRIKNKSTTLNTRPSSIDSHMSSPCRQPYTASRIRKPTTDNPNSKIRKRIANSLPRASYDPADDEQELELPLSEPTKQEFNYGEEQIARLSRALAQEFLNQTGFVLGGELKRNRSDSSARKSEAPANKSQQNTASYGKDNPSYNSSAMESPQRNNMEVDKARKRRLAIGIAEMARYGGMFEDFTQGIQSFEPTNQTTHRTKPKVQRLAAKKRLLCKRETLTMSENKGDPNTTGRSVCFNKQSPERVNNICDKNSVSPQKTPNPKKPIYSWNVEDRSFDSGGYVDPNKKAKSGPLPKQNVNDSTRQRLPRAQQIGEGVCEAINKELSCDRAGLNCTKLSGHFKPTDHSNIDGDEHNDGYEEYDDEEDNESRCRSEDEEDYENYMINKELKTFEDVNNKGVAGAEIKMYDKAGSMKSNLGKNDEGDNCDDKDDDFDDDCTVEDMICDQIAKCIELVNHSGDKALKACSDIDEAVDYSIDEDINHDRVDDGNYDNEDVIDDGNDNGEDDQLDRDDKTECNSNRNEFNDDDDQEEDEEEMDDDEEEEEGEDEEEEEYANEDYDDDMEDEDLDTFSVISCMSNDVNGVSLDRNDSREEEGEEEDEVEDEEEEEDEEDNEEDEEEEDDDEEENTNGKEETDEDEKEEKQEKDDDDNEDDDLDIEERGEEEDEEDAVEEEEGEEEDDEADIENCEEVTVIQRYGCYEKGESMPPNYDNDLNDDNDGVGDTIIMTVNTSNVVDEQLYDEWIHNSDSSKHKDNDYDENDDDDDEEEEEGDGLNDDGCDNDEIEICDYGKENDMLGDVNDNRREDDEEDDDGEEEEEEYDLDDADDVINVGVVQNNENEQFAV